MMKLQECLKSFGWDGVGVILSLCTAILTPRTECMAQSLKFEPIGLIDNIDMTMCILCCLFCCSFCLTGQFSPSA